MAVAPTLPWAIRVSNWVFLTCGVLQSSNWHIWLVLCSIAMHLGLVAALPYLCFVCCSHHCVITVPWSLPDNYYTYHVANRALECGVFGIDTYTCTCNSSQVMLPTCIQLLENPCYSQHCSKYTHLLLRQRDHDGKCRFEWKKKHIYSTSTWAYSW